MTNAQENIAKTVLYIIALIGLIPVALLGSMMFRQTASLNETLSSLLNQPAIPITFAILFALGCGICIYLARKRLLILLLPLLFVALNPLWIGTAQTGQTATPPFYYGQTQPGEGFERYNSDAWKIRIDYPQSLQDKLKASGKKPIVMASIGGNGFHWFINNLGIYPYTNADKSKDWWHGFELYFKNLDHIHTIGHGTTSKPIIKSPLDWPISQQWFISYTVIIPED